MSAVAVSEEASRRGLGSRNKGAWFERKVAAWLSEHGFPHAERGVRNGWRTDERVIADPFDIVGIPGLLWSLKCGAPSYTSEPACARYLGEVHLEAQARGLTGLLVVKRSGVADIGASWCHRMLELNGDGVLFPVRMTLRDAVTVLRAEGYGEPLEQAA